MYFNHFTSLQYRCPLEAKNFKSTTTAWSLRGKGKRARRRRSSRCDAFFFGSHKLRSLKHSRSISKHVNASSKTNTSTGSTLQCVVALRPVVLNGLIPAGRKHRMKETWKIKCFKLSNGYGRSEWRRATTGRGGSLTMVVGSLHMYLPAYLPTETWNKRTGPMCRFEEFVNEQFQREDALSKLERTWKFCGYKCYYCRIRHCTINRSLPTEF